jgi:hypothetical protein
VRRVGISYARFRINALKTRREASMAKVIFAVFGVGTLALVLLTWIAK